MVRRRLGQEPDVLFPANRHVRSSGLSGAPSLAHQPHRAKYTDISLSMTPGRDPGPQTSTVASASLFLPRRGPHRGMASFSGRDWSR